MSTYDVIVIGGGPAGTAAARDAAAAGARVAILDDSHPREKPCGGGVTGRALALAGTPAGADGARIEAVVFEAAGRRARVPVQPGDDPLLVYAREPFDLGLLRRAESAGAEVVRARATRIDRDGASWRVLTTRGALSARWVLGADGACGIARRTFHRPFSRDELSVAAGYFVDGASVADITIAFLDEPAGYFWSFPRPDHLAAGACAQADQSSPAAMYDATARWLDGYQPAAGKPRRRYSWPIPSLTAAALARERNAGDGWMLLGDAAGLVDPITREGIYFALRSGQFAAAALTRTDPADAYTEAVADEIHGELRHAARLKAAFFQPRFTRLLIDALNESAGIRRVMLDLVAGRQPYGTLKRRLLGTLEVGLMWRLWKRR